MGRRGSIFARLSGVVVLLLGSGGVAPAQSNVWTLYVVGYVNTAFHAGDTLFGNPLENTSRLLSTVIPTAPEGTAVSLWSSAANAYTQTSSFQSGGWSLNFSLEPGQGAKLTTPIAFTNTFVGYVLTPNGRPFTNEADLYVPPPAFAGGNGTHLLSSKTPWSLGGERSVFTYILGRNPIEGEQFTRLDSLTLQYRTTAYLAGAWDNGEPQLGVGEAAFFLIVPEPSTLALLILGSFAIAATRPAWDNWRASLFPSPDSSAGP